MATLTLTFDTGTVPLSKIVNAICLEYNYQANILDANGNTIPNPETQAVFAKRMVGIIIRNIVKNQDLITAYQTADASVTTITLT